MAQQPPSGQRPPHYRDFMTTFKHTTLGSTPLDEWSARRRDIYLTTHNNHNRQTSMPPAGFEPTIPANERPQTYALDRVATETGTGRHWSPYLTIWLMYHLIPSCCRMSLLINCCSDMSGSQFLALLGKLISLCCFCINSFDRRLTYYMIKIIMVLESLRSVYTT